MTYKFIGSAEEPSPVANIFKEIPCKNYHTEELPVLNWLKTPQEFAVVTESGSDWNRSPYKLTGNSVIEVPGNSTRQYKWGVYVLKEGTVNFKVENLYIYFF